MMSARHRAPWLRYGDGTIYRGELAQETGPPAPPAPGPAGSGRPGVDLRFYDRDGILLGVISSDWGTQNLLSARATVTTSGPGTLEFAIGQLPNWAIAHGTRVDMHLHGAADAAWSGYLTKVPSAISTERPFQYEALGWKSQVSGIVLAATTWSRWRLYQVVRDVAQRHIEPQTRIIYDPLLVDGGATYVLGDYRAERVTLTSVLDDLRDMAGLYVWGVDAQRRFYFRPVAQDVMWHWWVGVHVASCEAETDSSRLANRVWIKMGKRLPGLSDQWIAYPVEDHASQARYGVRETTITAPSVYSESDAVRMASVTLGERREPTMRIRLRGLTEAGPIPCEGKARVVGPNGDEEVRPIEQVTYAVSGARVEVEVDLGDRPVDVGRWLASWAGQQERLEALQQAAQRQTELVEETE